MEQNAKRSKILYTVLAVLLTVSVLPVVIVGWQLVALNRDTLRWNEQRFQLDSVGDKAKQIKLYITAYRDQIGAFARSLEIAGGVSALEESKSRDQKLGDTINNDNNLCALMITPLTPDKEKNASYYYAINKNKITDEELGPLISEAIAYV